MANWVKAFKRTASAFKDSFGPSEYAAAGMKVVCTHCGASEFAEGNALLNTTGMTLAQLDWADKTATTLACTNCGKVQLFIRKPERLE